MTLTEARGLIRRFKSNVGIILRKFQDMRVNPKNWSLSDIDTCRSHLGLNLRQIHHFYSLYPELKPIRVRQTNLFS